MPVSPVAGSPDAYREALERLYGRERGNKGPFTLEGTRALLAGLDHPEQRFAALHIAGTNGKGSTAALLERCLRAAGARTGLFTSPHLVDFRERIRVDGRMADATATGERLGRIAALAASPGRTFFEATFALGALTFAEEGVNVGVLETGLGGRLDSTNVVTPALAVITPVGFDHMDMLGDTLEAIAGEKAGIVKPGRPVVVAPQDARAFAVIEARARAVGAPLVRVDGRARVAAVHRLDRTGSELTLEVEGWGAIRIRLGLLGRHQWTNALTAAVAMREVAQLAGAPGSARAGIAALRFEPAHVAEGLARARWPGRFEASRAEPRLFWDGAHNPDGARVLREAWREALVDPPVALVVGWSSDKDGAAMVDALKGPVRRVYAVAADSPRAVAPAEVARLARERLPGVPVHEAGAVKDGVRAALASLAGEELALACGSLFVVGEAMHAVGEGALECL